MSFSTAQLDIVLVLLLVSLLLQVAQIEAFSFTLFDRFRPICPASTDAICHYDPTLDLPEHAIWVAVYRSSNNQPAVMIRDEFEQAMRSATGMFNIVPDSSTSISDKFSVMAAPKQTPVAIARLRPSTQETSNSQEASSSSLWVMDCMRCMLKKENMDHTCDGGSEHCEALSVAIDALLHHYLQRMSTGQSGDTTTTTTLGFEGAIRTKATLISAPLLEDRGFVPVATLQHDMASHISSLDACLQKYAQRSIDTSIAKSPGSRQRALDIVSNLGRLDRTRDLQQHAQRQKQQGQNNDDEPNDPWAGFKMF